MNKKLSQQVLGLVDIKLDVLTFLAFQAIRLLIFYFPNFSLLLVVTSGIYKHV
jgi:hypothetical protein